MWNIPDLLYRIPPDSHGNCISRDTPEVATTKERLDDLTQRLGSLETRTSAAQSHLESQAPARGIKWLWHFMLRNQGLAVLTLLITIAVPWYLYHLGHESEDFNYRVGARIDEKLKPANGKLDELGKAVTRIDSTLSALQPFIQDLVIRQMDKAAALPESEFRNNLSEVEHTISIARERNIKSDSKTVHKLGGK